MRGGRVPRVMSPSLNAIYFLLLRTGYPPSLARTVSPAVLVVAWVEPDGDLAFHASLPFLLRFWAMPIGYLAVLFVNADFDQTAFSNADKLMNVLSSIIYLSTKKRE